MLKIITNRHTTLQVDLEHYKAAWGMGTSMMTPDRIKGTVQTRGLLVSPQDDSLENLLAGSSRFRKYYSLNDPNTIAFFEGQNNKFYADSFTTGMQLLNVHKWIHSLKNLNVSPLKDVVDQNHELYGVVWTWMFKHNIRFVKV